MGLILFFIVAGLFSYNKDLRFLSKKIIVTILILPIKLIQNFIK